MENWEDILKKNEAKQRMDADAATRKNLEELRKKADANIREYYRPLAQTIHLSEQLTSIRNNVWKKGEYYLQDDFEEVEAHHSGFMGQGGYNYKTLVHRYSHNLVSGKNRLRVAFRGESSVNIEISSVPSVSGNIYGVFANFDVYTWQTARNADLPHRFEVSLAKYCKAMTEKGYLTKNGLVS